MNAAHRGRSDRRAGSWPTVLIGSVALAAVPAAALAVGPAPARSPGAAAVVHRLFVSTAGHAGAPGTRRDPMASVAEAVGRLSDGGVVVVRGGTYAQRVVLRDVHGVAIRPFRHEDVILDGGPLTPGPGRTAMVTVGTPFSREIVRCSLVPSSA